MADERGDAIGLVSREFHRAEPRENDHERPSQQRQFLPTALGHKQFIPIENTHIELLKRG
jgi:hypothetical protein